MNTPMIVRTINAAQQALSEAYSRATLPKPENQDQRIRDMLHLASEDIQHALCALDMKGQSDEG